MREIEQAVQTALHGRLVKMGISQKAIARLAPRAVITRQGKDFLIGHLCWRDASGEEIEGPEIEVSLSRALGEAHLVADFVRGLIDTCIIPPEPPAQPAAVAALKTTKAAGTETLSAPEPAFLIGAPGAGFASLAQGLGAHPAICTGAESHFFTLFGGALEMAERMGQHETDPDGPLPYCGVAHFEQSLRRLWSDIFASFHAAHPAARLHLERVGLHSETLSDIHRLFPKAPIMLFLSESRGGHPLPADAQAAALAWQRSHPDHPFLLIREEALQADQRATLARVLEFLLPEEPPSALEAVLSAHAAARAETGLCAPKPVPAARGWAGKFLRWRRSRKSKRARV